MQKLFSLKIFSTTPDTSCKSDITRAKDICEDYELKRMLQMEGPRRKHTKLFKTVIN